MHSKHYRQKLLTAGNDTVPQETYFETDQTGYVTRQIELFPDGRRAQYDAARPWDDDGGLSTQRISEPSQGLVLLREISECPPAKPGFPRSFRREPERSVLSYESTGTEPKHRGKPGSAGVLPAKFVAVVLVRIENRSFNALWNSGLFPTAKRLGGLRRALRVFSEVLMLLDWAVLGVLGLLLLVALPIKLVVALLSLSAPFRYPVFLVAGVATALLGVVAVRDLRRRRLSRVSKGLLLAWGLCTLGLMLLDPLF